MKKNLIISGATRNNWNRLNVEESEIENKLSKMANKLYSKKNIIPVEYFQNKDNFVILEDLSGYIKNNSLTIPAVIYNLSLNQLIKFGLAEIVNGKIYSENKYLLDILNELKNEPIIEYLIKIPLPVDEYDILGIVYQSMLIEGNKNKFGSYYTPRKIAQKFVKEINPDTVYLDPCCGTGGFLLTFADTGKIKTPENLYGFDKDYIA
ncbi:MAG: N-6 DNA methylase, partial [Candidatus Gastranaerophilales bacterium]|nr:N-6 DNA methylase [Candidatus Gastranaerophilales bacterium]